LLPCSAFRQETFRNCVLRQQHLEHAVRHRLLLPDRRTIHVATRRRTYVAAMTELLNPDTVSPNAAAAGVEESSLARGERGQTSVLVILCVVPFVLLVAFIFN